MPKFCSSAKGPARTRTSRALPFVGRSGKLLDSYLEAIDLSRERNIFIANIEHAI